MRRSFLASLVLFAGLAPFAANARSAVETVAGFYEEPIFNPLDPSDMGRLTEPALGVVERDVAEAGGEVGCIGFVLTVDAQDYDEAEIARTLEVSETVQGEDAEVTAEFSLFGEPRRIVWTMREESGEWKVADIASESGGWRLSEMCR